ncbi:DMT family transporter [Deinococcus maricopensis]|uniref:EamA domain-containing protein n=1 Tax=Deinococcus maricopensis (strain DSM 21211 / LMG 22137 / NRRL B-23946 / LB-34) TaxID=709986 RepID=E8UAP8_DEIML|nr:DMT family transporter [Deinococcus maricopensis]ADV68137.1 protein of unknown function DUF606 [Deinococcus maricopensis DSM 21211]
MKVNTAPWLALAVAAGLLLPAQFAVNAALARTNGSAPLTAFTSYVIGTLTLAVMIALTPAARAHLTRLRSAPAWTLTGGLLGSAYVLGSVVLTRELGAGLAVTLVIAAQTLMSVLLDHFGALGLERRPLNPTRLLVVALILIAVVLRALSH